MLIFVELFDVEQRVLIVRIEANDLVERFKRPIDESTALEVEAEAQQDMRLLEARDPRALQQALMNVDRARHLPLFAIEAPKQQMNLERVAEALGGFAELLDREIDLVGHEKIQSDDVVERFGDAAAVDQPARAQFVPLPRFPDRQSDEKRDERSEEWIVGAQNSSVRQRLCRWRTPATVWALPPTTSDVILRCSMMSRACAASVDGSITIGRLVMMSPAVMSPSRVLPTSARRRSPSVMIPTSSFCAFTTHVMPSAFFEIS